MEAAKPIEFETPNLISEEEIETKMIDIKSFDIKLNNKNLKIEFAKSENKNNIIFKISEKDIFLLKNFYYLQLNIDNLFNLNAIFRLYKSIDEIYEFLLVMINEKKYIISEIKGKLILLFNYQMPGGKKIDIKFELKEKRINTENLIRNLSLKVEELSKENKLIKNEQEKIKEELLNKNNEYDNIKKELNSKNLEIQEIKKELVLLKNSFKISKIL